MIGSVIGEHPLKVSLWHGSGFPEPDADGVVGTGNGKMLFRLMHGHIQVPSPVSPLIKIKVPRLGTPLL